MINVALAGTWHVHFNGYARSVANNPNCRITALWDPSAEITRKIRCRCMVQSACFCSGMYFFSGFSVKFKS